MVHVHGAAANTIEGEAGVAVPRYQVEGSLIYAATAVERGQPTGQLVAQHEQTGRVAGQQRMQGFKRAIRGEQPPGRWRLQIEERAIATGGD